MQNTETTHHKENVSFSKGSRSKCKAQRSHQSGVIVLILVVRIMLGNEDISSE